jgi:single-stranded-DNA-specific exonuclease
VDFLVPNRFEFGYGLTPGIVDVAAQKKPDILITVDNGISSHEGVERARELGIDVVVTDHHLAGEHLPNAAVIVNPNQPDDTFSSKAMAGVGVIFYVMLALRACLKNKSWFEQENIPEPNMGSLLDIVALGTVADVVPLDYNNRILIHHGLKRIQSGKCCEGILALLRVAKRDVAGLVASDLAFAIAPRLNAAGRLDDMSLGIQCLLTDDPAVAEQYAQQLDELNLERREIEQEMQQQAFQLMDSLALDPRYLPNGLCLYEPSWHQGVIGILAGRMKDKFHRPVIAFADSNQENELKGSARSIPGIHIRDSLDAIAKRHPELLEKFGGHAMAAGLSIKKSNFSAFQKVFRDQITQELKDESPRAELWTDGALSPEDFNLDLALLLRESGPWGQHFPEPLFDSVFTLHQHYLLKGKHLKMCLGYENHPLAIDAIAFNVDEGMWPNPRCKKVYAVYKLDINEYQGRRTVQLLVEHLQPA